MLSVSERLSKFFPEGCLRDLPKKLKRFVSSTQVLRKVLASCTTSVYVNLSKNSFFWCAAEVVSSLAGAKVQTFPEPTKLFKEKFQFKRLFRNALDAGQSQKVPTPYYILYKETYITTNRKFHYEKPGLSLRLNTV